MTGRNTGFLKEALCPSEKTLPLNVQGDSGEKFNILMGNSIRHCDTNFLMNMCLILSCYRVYEYNSIVSGTEGREITASLILYIFYATILHTRAGTAQSV